MTLKADRTKKKKHPWWFGIYDFCFECKKQVKVKPDRFNEDTMQLTCQECGEATYEYN